jgi:hypothetical protein
MSKLLSILLAGAAACGAATHTVCASGCTYSNLQTALNAAGRGDVLELKAGEIFEGAFVLPYKTGTGNITVRSSRWRELPPPATRITAAAAALMPTLQPNHGSVPVVSAGYYEQYVSSVSTSTDTLLFSDPHGFANGDPVACWGYDRTIPVVENQIYYVRDATSNTIKLALVPNGAVVDLLAPHTATYFRCTLARSVRGWKFHGIEFRSKPGQMSQYNLITMGNGETAALAGMVSNIEFDHVYIHGIDGEEGPNVCVYVNTRALSIIDSRIESCKLGGYESKAISIPEAPGPLLFRNNHIESAAINVLLGGSSVRIEAHVPGDGGGIIFEGNHFFKPLSYHWTAGAGGPANPSGACSEGAKYLNTASGVWFVCSSSSTWAVGPTCANGEYFKRTNVAQNCASGACWSCNGGVFTSSSVFREYSYAVKNLFEIKSGINVIVRGNIFENNWIDGQDGIAVWIVAQNQGNNTSGFARGDNIRFERNIVRNSAQGVRIASTNDPLLLMRNRRVQLTDNLIYKIGSTDYPSINSLSARPLSFGGPCDDCVVDHNTVVSGVAGGQGVYFDTAAFARPRLSNSILYANAYGLYGDGGLPISTYWGNGNVVNTVAVDNLSGYGAPSSFGSYAINGKYITPATPLFTGTGDYRLLPTSPYSARCTTGCDFAATDGKDLGADIDAVEAATAGVTGTGSIVARMGIQVETGSRHAIVRYRAPTAAACSLSLFTNAARTILHADTPDAGTQSDARAGNIVDGQRREAVLGTVALLAPSTLYQARLDCGSLRIPIPVRTAASGAAEQHTLRFTQPAAVRYANNLSFTGATNLAAATRHEIPVPPGSVVYIQVGSLPAKVVAGR